MENLIGEDGKGLYAPSHAPTHVRTHTCRHTRTHTHTHTHSNCIMANFNHERWMICVNTNRFSRLMTEEAFKWANQRIVRAHIYPEKCCFEFPFFNILTGVQQASTRSASDSKQTGKHDWAHRVCSGCPISSFILKNWFKLPLLVELD